MVRIVLIALVLLGCATATGRDTPPSGDVRVVDGDTLHLGGTRIRLHGIDAPEAGQTCGGERVARWDCGAGATAALKQLVAGGVGCTPRDRDRYGRIVAVCRSGGRDIGAEMVAAGWAVAYRRYATDYVIQEENARRSGAGLWRGTFIRPAEHRRGARQAEAPPDAACRIKGNISEHGRIYHAVGTRWYRLTRISREKGERWFCSEARARAAGWRAAGS